MTSDAYFKALNLGPRWRLRPSLPAETQLVRPPADPPTTHSPLQKPPTNSNAPQALDQVPHPILPAETAKPLSAGVADIGRVERILQADWDALTAEVHACQACTLCEKRQHAVPGVGDQQATWMFVGEGPGAEEDARGEPFVGPAGQLLDAMLSSIGLTRKHDVFITNAVKCRPPHNRTPEAHELRQCAPFLQRQIALVQPKLLIALGRPAAQILLQQEDLRISAIRSKVHQVGDIPLIVTYHPAYLLRTPADKLKAWEDFCLMQKIMPRSP